MKQEKVGSHHPSLRRLTAIGPQPKTRTLNPITHFTQPWAGTADDLFPDIFKKLISLTQAIKYDNNQLTNGQNWHVK